MIKRRNKKALQVALKYWLIASLLGVTIVYLISSFLPKVYRCQSKVSYTFLADSKGDIEKDLEKSRIAAKLMEQRINTSDYDASVLKDLNVPFDLDSLARKQVIKARLVGENQVVLVETFWDDPKQACSINNQVISTISSDIALSKYFEILGFSIKVIEQPLENYDPEYPKPLTNVAIALFLSPIILLVVVIFSTGKRE